jgi:hypothetical protein
MYEKVFGPKRDKVIDGRRKSHNEVLHNLYSSSNIITIIKSRGMGWVGHVPRMGAKRSAYRYFALNPEGKRPLERLRDRCEDNIKMDVI